MASKLYKMEKWKNSEKNQIKWKENVFQKFDSKDETTVEIAGRL